MSNKDKSKYFPLPLTGRFIGKKQWELTKTFKYLSKKDGIIEVHPGFITDGASIPWVVYSLIGSPWSGRYPEGAVIHDYLYFIQEFTRKKSDLIFYEAMKVLGVFWLKRRIMYYYVRALGWIPWNKRKKQIAKTKKEKK